MLASGRRSNNLTIKKREIWTGRMLQYYTLHLLIIAEERFHLATDPFHAILAAQFWNGGWSSIHQRWADSKAGKVVLIFASPVILLLQVNRGLELWRFAGNVTLLSGPNGNQIYPSY
jgi:hypothetical protein